MLLTSLHAEVHNTPNVLTVQLCNLVSSSEVDAGAVCAPLSLQQNILDRQRQQSHLQCQQNWAGKYLYRFLCKAREKKKGKEFRSAGTLVLSTQSQRAQQSFSSFQGIGKFSVRTQGNAV